MKVIRIECLDGCIIELDESLILEWELYHESTFLLIPYPKYISEVDLNKYSSVVKKVEILSNEINSFVLRNSSLEELVVHDKMECICVDRIVRGLEHINESCKILLV